MPVIFFQHGLSATSDAVLANIEKDNVGFLLAEKGYDVWLGNSRATRYSMGHVKYDSSDKKSDFWKTSFE